MTALATPHAAARPLWRAPAFWLSAIIGLFQAVNAVRAFADPAGFADYMGLPLGPEDAVGFVHVYGLRTAFIAVMTAIFLVRRELAPLQWVALAALIMPVGDAVLTAGAGAPTATVVRHVAIAVYLAVTFAALRAYVAKGGR
jgi:hypothetical protein